MLNAVGKLMEQLMGEETPPAPAYHQPQTPDATIPRLLHREHDGLVPLARKERGNWHELGSISPAQLSGLFADEFVADAVSVDSYFGLHGMYRPTRTRTPHQHMLPGCVPSRRGVDAVRWLTCFHVDLDCYRHKLDSHGAIAAVSRLVDAGLLPSPSIYTLSRGCWAIWRLHDQEKTNEPLRAYGGNVVRRWAAVQDALHAICSGIGSDPAAKNAATVTRIPGSVNSKNGERVGYMIPASIRGKLYSYSLDDMESLLSNQLRRRMVTVPVETRIPDERRKALGKKGSVSRWNHMLSSLETLRNMRGGWREGTRHSALFYVAVACTNLGMPEEQTLSVMEQHLSGMAESRDEQVTTRTARQTIRSVQKGQDNRGRRIGHVRNQTIADALLVTPDEASALSVGRREPFPAALAHGGAVPRLTKSEESARRRQAVERVVCQLKSQGVTVTGSVVRGLLADEGVDACLATVLKDLERLGCPSEKSHRLPATPDAYLPGMEPG
jgi:hypothetical protein